MIVYKQSSLTFFCLMQTITETASAKDKWQCQADVWKQFKVACIYATSQMAALGYYVGSPSAAII